MTSVPSGVPTWRLKGRFVGKPDSTIIRET